MCSISIQGLWKFVQHSYVHDKEPRFCCPACGKRMIKVQNFKDHIQRHLANNEEQHSALQEGSLQGSKQPSGTATPSVSNASGIA